MSGNKLVVFNVGWAFSAYCEVNWKRILVDLGRSDAFSPITDFLVPYAKRMGWSESILNGGEGKFHLDQLIISHPHKDHISDIKPFWDYFYPQYVTTPNGNDGMDEDDKINWSAITTPDDPDVKFLRETVISQRKPPLISTTNGLDIFYLPAKISERDLPSADYTNNLSLVCILQVGEYRVVLPGDVMPTWMNLLLNGHSSWIKERLTDKQVRAFDRAISKKEVDILIAPHHWLKSSFSTDFMKKMNALKLVIIPEKPQSSDSVRQVDDRYYSNSFSSGMTLYDYDQAKNISQNGIKTSCGHLVVSWSGVSLMKESSRLLDLFTLN